MLLIIYPVTGILGAFLIGYILIPVGDFIMSLIKGYAGLSVIVSFFNYIFFYAVTFGSYEELIVNTLIQILIPIALTCFNTISIMFLDLARERNIKYVRYCAKKLGIIDQLEIAINKI